MDNASGDDTVAMVTRTFPEITLIANSYNAGFAKANNQGIMQAHSDYLLLLNPDTEVTKDALQKMLEHITNNEQIGILGCKHINTNLTLQHSVRRFPTVMAIFLIFSKIAKIMPGAPSLEHYFATDFNYKQTGPVDQVAGSCMLVRQALLKDIGLLDEKFFIWFEEVDLCKRAHDAGWEVWYHALPKIIHHGGASFGQQMTLKKQILFFKSALYYFRKHGFLK